MKENLTENLAALARRCVCLVVLASVSASPRPAKADQCADEAVGPAIFELNMCGDGNPDIDFANPDPGPGLTIAGGNSNTPWIAAGSANVPVAITSSSNGVSARTSLQTLRDFNSRAATLSLVPLAISSSVTPTALSLPKAPARRSAPIDVWSNVDLQGYDQQQASFGETGVDATTRASAGVDYKITNGAKVGVSAERADARTAALQSGVQQDGKMAAYITLQAAPALSLDARTEWQEGNAAFAEATGVAEKNSVSVAPRLDHTFALEDGNTLQPFVSYKTIYDISEKPNPGTTPEALLSQSAAAGVTLAKPDSYSLSVSTDVDGLSAALPPSVNGKFELKLPLH